MNDNQIGLGNGNRHITDPHPWKKKITPYNCYTSFLLAVKLVMLDYEHNLVQEALPSQAVSVKPYDYDQNKLQTTILRIPAV